MLAEIFMIRMEAISRASKETEPADNSRFLPITLADLCFLDNSSIFWTHETSGTNSP